MFRFSLTLAVVAILTACGGGSSEAPAPRPSPPVPSDPPSVEMKVIKNVDGQLVLSANVSGSSASNLTYSWRQLSGQTIDLGTADKQELTLSYADIEYAQKAQFEVEVTDQNNHSDRDQLSVDLDVLRTIYLVVDDDLERTLSSELEALSAAISADTNAHVSIVTAPGTPFELRALLKTGVKEKGLRGALLVGDVPLVYDVRGALSDHYYRALDCDYQGTDQTHIKEAPKYSTLMENCFPTIWVSRIVSHDIDKEQKIRRYLTKNVELRNNFDSYENEMVINQALGWQTVDIHKQEVDELLKSYTADYGVDVQTVGDISAHQHKSSILAGLQSNIRLLKVNTHGSELLMAPQGTDVADVSYIYAKDILPSSHSPRAVEFESCSVGGFGTPGYLAGKVLFNGETLLVDAFPTVTSEASTYYFAQRFLYKGLWQGKSYADMYTFSFMGQPSHYLGDPTIRLQQPQSAKPSANIIFDGIDFEEPFVHQRTFNSVKSGESDSLVINILNQGIERLEMIVRSPHFITVNKSRVPLQGMTGGSIFYLDDDETPVNYEVPGYGDGTLNFAVEPGKSVDLKFVFDPSFDNEKPAETDYSALVKFASNDPQVPIFLVRLVGSKIRD